MKYKDEKIEVTLVAVISKTIVVEVEGDDDERESKAAEQASNVFARPLEELGYSVTETEVYVEAKNKNEN